MKSFIKSLFVCSLLMIVLVGSLFAQDSTAVVAAATSALPSWVPLVGTIVLGVYELLVRYVPTVKNYSIIGLVIRIIQAVIPNNNASTPSQPHP